MDRSTWNGEVDRQLRDASAGQYALAEYAARVPEVTAALDEGGAFVGYHHGCLLAAFPDPQQDAHFMKLTTLGFAHEGVAFQFERVLLTSIGNHPAYVAVDRNIQYDKTSQAMRALLRASEIPYPLFLCGVAAEYAEGTDYAAGALQRFHEYPCAKEDTTTDDWFTSNQVYDILGLDAEVLVALGELKIKEGLIRGDTLERFIMQWDPIIIGEEEI
ncbi:MAG: hypothetical protein ACOCWQ_02740 [Nanoarchaeota archaeon]